VPEGLATAHLIASGMRCRNRLGVRGTSELRRHFASRTELLDSVSCSQKRVKPRARTYTGGNFALVDVESIMKTNISLAEVRQAIDGVVELANRNGLEIKRRMDASHQRRALPARAGQST
jgi:hypothetical protein